MNNNNSHNQAKALVDAWFILLRYKWRFIVPMFLASSFLLVGSLFLPHKYNASAVFDRRTDVILYEIMLQGANNAFSEHRQTITQEIAGSPAITQVIEDIKPYIDARVKTGTPPVDLNELRSDLKRKVLVNFDISSKSHERVRVSYVGTDSVVSRLVVNQLVRNYIKLTRHKIERRFSEANQFYDKEVQTARHKIELLENKKLDYEINHNKLLPGKTSQVINAQREMKSEILSIKQLRDNAKLQADAFRDAINKTSKQVETFVKEKNPELTRLETRLSQLISLRRSYRNVKKMTRNHPDYADLEYQINLVKQKIALTDSQVITRTQYTKNPRQNELALLLARSESEFKSYSSQYNALAIQTKSMGINSAELFPVRTAYRKIMRQIEQLHRELGFWETKLRQTDMALAAESGNRGVQLAFIGPCGELTYPVSPDILQIMIAVFGLSLMTGSISLLFAHRTNESVSDPERLARSCEMPLLGSVSEIISNKQRKMRRIRNLVIYPANALAMLAVVLTLTTMVYLNLRRPDLYEKVKQGPFSFVSQQIDHHMNR